MKRNRSLLDRTPAAVTAAVRFTVNSPVASLPAENTAVLLFTHGTKAAVPSGAVFQLAEFHVPEGVARPRRLRYR